MQSEVVSDIVFDIVIPVGPNEKTTIYNQINYTKQNVVGYRNIYLICYDPNIQIDDCITIDEKIFPFSIKTVSKFHGESWRNGWYLQQLLKLYAGKIISGILDKYLVIDADTFFLKPTVFVENGKCLYNVGSEHVLPYFEHMRKLDAGLERVNKNISGICHHMMFETKYIDEIITKIETAHNDTFYNVFLKLVSPTEIEGSGASEYEIYFNYMLKYHSDMIKIRLLEWTNSAHIPEDPNLYYASCHHYIN
jgi:hypothetical protein